MVLQGTMQSLYPIVRNDRERSLFSSVKIVASGLKVLFQLEKEASDRFESKRECFSPFEFD